MLLQSLRVHSFRNLQISEMHFGAGLNVLFGRNGQGKTNLLESIYVLGLTKSFRAARLNECLRHGQAEFALWGRVESGVLRREVGLGWSDQGKDLKVDGKSAPLLQYLGNLDALVVSFDQLPVVHGAPEERRRFLDRSIAIVDKAYVHLLAEFRHVLRQRNLLLGRIREGAARAAELDAWDGLYLASGALLTAKRQDHVNRLNAALAGTSISADALSLEYRASLPSEPGQAAAVMEQARRLDIERKRTGRGPHRDELLILLDGRPIQRVGSGGQQRSAIFSLLFASREIYVVDKKEVPVILIDDLDAELDMVRLQNLLERLAIAGQVFVSTAKEKIFESIAYGQAWEMAAGRANALGDPSA